MMEEMEITFIRLLTALVIAIVLIFLIGYML